MRRVVRAVTMDFIGVGKRSLTFLILFALGMELHARALAPIDRLPSGRLLVGYATDRCLREEDRIIAAVENGVNVIIWSFAHFERQGDGELRVHPTFNVDKVRALRERLEGTGAEVAHLVAFGGWNGPHPSTKASGKQWFECWRIWNDKHGMPFDGIDWDLEGHDDPKATSASFTKALVDLVSDFSVVAHRAGFTVALAPAQSYLDAATSEFSLRLNHEPGVNPGKFPEPEKVESFPYSGRNAYAAIIHQAGIDCFSLISIQLYEGYSRACYAITRLSIPAETYIADTARKYSSGFDVKFVENGEDSIGATTARIVVPPNKLSFGFANAWADGNKFLRVQPKDIVSAYMRLPIHERPRGVMFWVIDEEGEPNYFAKDLSSSFRVAEGESTSSSTGEF